MITFLYILMVLACIIIVTAVLLQPSKGGGMSALGGSNQSVFGSTGGNSFLFNMTMWCAAFIMATSLFLSRYQINKNKSSVFDEVPVSTTQTLPPPVNGTAPNAATGAASSGTPNPTPTTTATDPAKSVANPAEATGAPAAHNDLPKAATSAPAAPAAKTDVPKK